MIEDTDSASTVKLHKYVNLNCHKGKQPGLVHLRMQVQ